MEYICNAAVRTIRLRKTSLIEDNCFPQQGQPVSGQAVSKPQLFINGVGAAGAGSGQARVTTQLKVRLGTGVASDCAAKERQKRYYDAHHGVHPLPELHPGSPVLLKKDSDKGWSQPAEIIRQVAPRSYLLQTERGNQLRRNRRHQALPRRGRAAANSQQPAYRWATCFHSQRA